MQRLFLLCAILALGAPVAALTQLPPGPTVPINHKFEDAHQLEVVQLILDFAPGAFTPVHTHGGHGFVSVVDGVMTVREAGTTKTYKAGETWREAPGAFAEVGNAGDKPSRILVSFLIPKGAALTTVQHGPSTQQLPPGPTTTYRSTFEPRGIPVNSDLIQLVMNFEAGAFTPVHTHGGEGFVTVLRGEMAVRENGQERRYKPGMTWKESPGSYAQVGNPGREPAQIAVTFLLPKGAPLTTTR